MNLISRNICKFIACLDPLVKILGGLCLIGVIEQSLLDNSDETHSVASYDISL
jgi:hypothetical protein